MSPSNSRLKQKLLSFCAFFGAFTVVMTILVCSTDIRGRRYHRLPVPLDAADLQNAAQDDPLLVNHIRHHHIRPPASQTPLTLLIESQTGPQNETVSALQSNIASVFSWKRGGVFVEADAYGGGEESRTAWLEATLGWRGLLTQPDPSDYAVLTERSLSRGCAHTANVCLSPTSNPKQASFRHTTSDRSESSPSHAPVHLRKVYCFPLYSLLLAYNTTTIDFLSLGAGGGQAEFQVLRTLPFHRVNIKLIGISLTPTNEDKTDDSYLERLKALLSMHGYKLDTEMTTDKQYLLFICSRCPL